MMKKSSNQKRDNETIDGKTEDHNSLPLGPAALIEEHSSHNAEEGRVSPTQNSEESNSRKTDSGFKPFQPIHPRCNHISYGCLTMTFLVFVGMAVLLKTYLPDTLPSSKNKLVASDGETSDFLGYSCSISDELVVAGGPWVDDKKGAAYLFHLDGTEVKKLTPGNDGDDDDWFGVSVSIDEKVVVGTWNGGYVQVFSREGIYEKTIKCDDCDILEKGLATHGNLIVLSGRQNSISKLLIYSIEGQFLKPLEVGRDWIDGIAISEQFIVSTARYGKTFVYSNSSPDFPKVAEINQGGEKVAVSSDRIVIGDPNANNYDGAVWLYNTDGTLVKSLDRHESTSGSLFGWSVDITDDKVIVGAKWDDDKGYRSGSVFIYSAINGEFIQKIPAPGGEAEDEFGSSVCASDSHYVVGARDDDAYTGAAYLFRFSED